MERGEERRLRERERERERERSENLGRERREEGDQVGKILDGREQREGRD